MNFFGGIPASVWRQPSVIALVLANLVPVFGVFYFGWAVFPLMFLFWSENVIVGVFNVLKMMVAMPFREGVLPMIPFFCVHYGFFTFIHGTFIIILFGGKMPAPAGDFPDPAVFWQTLKEQHLVWPALGLAVSHGVSFVTNYLGRSEYRRITPPLLMFQPYGRIVVLHVALIAGGFLMQALHSPALGLVVLIVLKALLDLKAHQWERQQLAGPGGGK